MFKRYVLNESASGLGQLMQLAGMPDEDRISSREDEEFLIMTRRLGILVEMIGRLSTKCDEIQSSAEFAMEENFLLRRGLLEKQPDGSSVRK
jgi:hypothetical protein